MDSGLPIYHRDGPIFMILPSELKHLEDEYKQMWVALRDFDRPAFKDLADHLPLTHSRDSGNNTVLHYAAAVGNPDSLAYALSMRDRPALDTVNYNGYTALQMALMNMTVNRSDHKLREVVRLLLEAGGDPRLPRGLNSALVSTSGISCPITVQRIYRSMLGREPNKRQLMLILRNADWSITHFMWTKDIQLLKHLIDYDNRSLTCSKFSATPVMHQAVEARAHPDVFTLLLSYGLDPNVTSPSLNTPLHRVCELAGEWNNVEVVEILLLAGANPNLRNRKRCNCLHMAAKSGSDAVVRTLIKYSMNHQEWDATGKTAMHYAAISGSVQVIATLQEIGLSVHEMCTYNGATTLHLASRYCRPEAVEYLISLGSCVNARDFRYKTALHYAVKKQANNLERRCTETVDLLVDHGGELFNEADGNISVLRYCIENRYLHNASIVIRHLALTEFNDPEEKEVFMRMIKKDEILQEAYDNCLVELELMKTTDVYGWVNMYKMLTGTNQLLRPLMRNGEFVIKMNSYIINRMIYQKFPNYCTRIINRFAELEREQRHIKKASESLSYLIGYGDPTDLIIGTIVKYLDPEDIDSLAEYRHRMIAESLLNFRREALIVNMHTVKTCLH